MTEGINTRVKAETIALVDETSIGNFRGKFPVKMKGIIIVIPQPAQMFTDGLL